MQKAHMAPMLAVYPSLTHNDIKQISASSTSYKSSDGTKLGRTWATDTLFEMQFGKNTFTHTVITWEDKLGRTILGFEADGLTEQTSDPSQRTDLSETEITHALDTISTYIAAVMANSLGRQVIVEALDPESC